MRNTHWNRNPTFLGAAIFDDGWHWPGAGLSVHPSERLRGALDFSSGMKRFDA